MMCNLFCFQSDLVNQSLYNFTHADERMKIYQLLSQHKVVPGNGVPDYEMGKSTEKWLKFELIITSESIAVQLSSSCVQNMWA